MLILWVLALNFVTLGFLSCSYCFCVNLLVVIFVFDLFWSWIVLFSAECCLELFCF